MIFSDATGEISKNPPTISFLDHGFLFGDSLYEVVRTYNRKIWGWQWHFDRLREGGEKLGIDIAALESDLKNRSHSILKALNTDNAAVRIIITRGVGKLHIDPRTCERPLIFMAAWPLETEILRKPVRLYIPKIRRNPKSAMDPAIKSGNYLNNVLALKEALEAGYDDALLLNPAGEITELTTSNIGWLKGDSLYTPHTDCGILHGITRRFWVTHEKVVEGRFTVDDLLNADEVFALSTFKEILPVTEVKVHDGRLWKATSHEKTQNLHARFVEKLNAALAGA